MADSNALIDLHTIYGLCAIAPADVVLVGPIFEKAGVPAQRTIGLRGGHKLYVLDSRDNLTALLGREHAERLHAAPLHPVVAAARDRKAAGGGAKRGRKPQGGAA